jgi:hypothetical protein
MGAAGVPKFTSSGADRRPKDLRSQLPASKNNCQTTMKIIGKHKGQR